MQKQINKYVVAPLLGEAQSADTIVNRPLFLQLALHSELAASQSTQILEEIAAERWSPREPNNHALSDMEASSERIIKIARELKR
jgi:hypothetical protein